MLFFRSLQDVQIWFQPNTSSSSDVFLSHSDSQDGFGKSCSMGAFVEAMIFSNAVQYHFMHLELPVSDSFGIKLKAD